MDSPKHIKYTHFVAVALFLVLALLPQQHFAQERKVQNRPYIDMRRWLLFDSLTSLENSPTW